MVFTGRQVLVVEDDVMIAMMVGQMLADLGCTVIGPFHRLAAGLGAVDESVSIDAAFLDVNLAGQPVFPLADALRARDVPMIFCTGYGEGGLREADVGSQVLLKPYRLADLAAALAKVLTPQPSAAGPRP